jgi:3-dehydroquinate dehydratase/shikimate dehydrogenase
MKEYQYMKKCQICLSVIESTIEKNISRIKEYKDAIDLVELRADYLKEEEIAHIVRFPARAGIPVILTIRRKVDGGMFSDEEAQRIRIMKNAIDGNFSYIDLEDDLGSTGIEEKMEASGGRIIRSFHDFNRVPEKLTEKMRHLARSPKELPKASVMPQCTEDVYKLFTCFRQLEGVEKILLGMGTFGFPTRVLAPFLGSFLTFCSVPDRLAASGHIDPLTITRLYRFRHISRETAIFGIIGNPVMHTFSPNIHNRGFSATGFDAVYVPFHVDRVEPFMNLARFLRIKGFSVTIPHKEQIIKHLTEKDRSVEATGACNTVIRGDNGYYGVNTDTTGFIESLKRALKDVSLQGKKATVIGAGGAAKAVIYSLLREGVDVLILNRTEERAKRLAETFHCTWAGLTDEGMKQIDAFSDIIVQTTSVGMEPETSANPIPDYIFKGHEVVFDIVYNPPITVLLKKAQQAGCRIIQGKEMLLGQAFAQFRLFTGREYPDQEGLRKEFQ